VVEIIQGALYQINKKREERFPCATSLQPGVQNIIYFATNPTLKERPRQQWQE